MSALTSFGWCVVYYLGAVAAVFIASTAFHRLVRPFGQVVKRKFPNGAELYMVCGDGGTELIFKEIFVDRTYFKNGVSLEGRKAPFVVDVGTNIGFFALSVMQEARDSTVECFEPVPKLAEAIRANLRPYIAEGRATVHNIGLGATECSVPFEADLSFSAASGMHGKDVLDPTRSATPLQWARALLLDAIPMRLLPAQPTTFLASLLDVPVLQYVALIAYVPFMLLGLTWFAALPSTRFVKFTAKIRPLESVLRERGLEGKRIDLLKVDVEGAEWEVLQGVSDKIWQNVDQVVVETHDINGRLAAVEALLREKGFESIIVEEEPLEVHKLLRLSTVFATRG